MKRTCEYCEEIIHTLPIWNKELKGWLCADCNDEIQAEKDKKQ